jgi:hypothetical protein
MALFNDVRAPIAHPRNEVGGLLLPERSVKNPDQLPGRAALRLIEPRHVHKQAEGRSFITGRVPR